MAAYDLEEQEQLSAMKEWWEKNSNRLTWGLLAIALVLLGWTGWHKYQESRAADAGILYAGITQAAQSNDVAKLRVLVKEVVAKHADLVSSQLSVMLLGKAEQEAGDIKAAHVQFEWAATKGSDPLVRDLARLRLAAVQMDEKDYAGANKTLEAAPATALLARFEDLRGDALFAAGNSNGAHEAYKKAMTALSQTSGQDSPDFRTVVQTKLDALGGA
jgi:predicted negative regulator of RcsB-dependent stress response